jgi:hypothetical protein
MVRGINWSKPGQFFSHKQKMVSHLTQRKNLKNIAAENLFCVDFSQYQEYSLHLTSVSTPEDYHKWGNLQGEQDIYELSHEAGDIHENDGDNSASASGWQLSWQTPMTTLHPS